MVAPPADTADRGPPTGAAGTPPEPNSVHQVLDSATWCTLNPLTVGSGEDVTGHRHHGRMARRDVDERVQRLADEQHGAFAWWQAQECGADKHLAARRVRSDLWQKPAPSVYVLRASAPTWRRCFKVAELSVPGSALSGRSALQVHDLPGSSRSLPHLIVPAGGPARSTIAVLHRGDLAVTMRAEGFRVATAEQAIFDIAVGATLAELERIIDRALLDRRASVARFEERLAAYEGAHLSGIAKLRRLVAERGEGFVVPESELERYLTRALKLAGVPDLVFQANPPWRPGDRRRFDALSRAWRIIFEADGRRWHSRMQDMERDRRRDQEAAAHGYLVMRFTWAQLTAGRHETVALIRAAGAYRLAA